mmetsp:Transcript_96824/g.166957  ORF Transcript_96824/g.166957 Transcript_96824/m.166957 type:complete len:220 (+) Transcript_96824:4927-5586(+)
MGTCPQAALAPVETCAPLPPPLIQLPPSQTCPSILTPTSAPRAPFLDGSTALAPFLAPTPMGIAGMGPQGIPKAAAAHTPPRAPHPLHRPSSHLVSLCSLLQGLGESSTRAPAGGETRDPGPDRQPTPTLTAPTGSPCACLISASCRLQWVPQYTRSSRLRMPGSITKVLNQDTILVVSGPLTNSRHTSNPQWPPNFHITQDNNCLAVQPSQPLNTLAT